MKLFFLRHGKAVERGTMPDAERYLTEEGIEKLEENLPYFGKYLGDDKVLIWSSPLKRAQETAEILIKYVSDYEYTEHDFIANGRVEYLISELSKQDKNVVVVGHEPSLSVWTFQLTGEEIEIKKGAMVEIEFDKNSPENGKFIQYKRIKSMSDLIELK